MRVLRRSKAIPAFGYVGVGLAFGLAALIAGTLAPSSAAESIGNIQYDLLYRNVRDEPPLDSRILFFDINDETADEYGFPLPRERYVELLGHLSKAQVRAVVFDSIFRGKTTSETDAKLADAFASAPSVLAIGAESPQRNRTPPDPSTDLPSELGRQPFTVGLFQPVRRIRPMWYTKVQAEGAFLNRATGGGHVAAALDDDGIARRIAPVVEIDGKMVPSLALAGVLVTLGVDLKNEVVDVTREGRTVVFKAASLEKPLRIPVDGGGSMLLNYRSDWNDERSQTPLDRRELLEQMESLAEAFDAMAPDLKDTTVFVGWSAGAASDYVAVPWSEGIVPGVLVSIAAANTILTGSHLYVTPGWMWRLLTLLAPLAVGIAWWRLSAARAGVATGAVVLALPLLSVATFAIADTFLPVVGALSAAVLAGATLAIASLSREQARAVRIAGVLSRFVSPALLRELEEGAARDRLPPAKRAECTILFIDVAGFTPFTEGQEPEALSAFLDGFYELAMEELEKQGGTLEKFMGDGLLAYFGAPEAQADKELRAVRAALAIRERFAKYDGQRVARGGLPLAIRCGITTDWVAVGYFGGGNRGTYGVIGRSVNLASRIQGHAEPGGILVDRTTSARLGGQVVFRPLPPIELKGIAKPVEIYAVAGTAPVGSVG